MSERLPGTGPSTDPFGRPASDPTSGPASDPASDEERRAAGTRTRREVLGDAWVDRAVAATTPFTAGFQDIITRTA